MGARAQVLIKDEGVYLYTHCGAGEIEEDVKRALAKKWRWDVPEYLARIIFEEMIPEGERMDETGFGIGNAEHGDIDRLVTVNCAEQKVTVKDIYEDSERSFSFEDFIKA